MAGISSSSSLSSPSSGKTDFFDRQKRIPEWNQQLIEQQVCLLLGIGGLGCTVALELVRLGVKKVFLVDRDTVDYHNLNRQILFSQQDLGKRKVEAAMQSLQKQHNLRTEIVPLHIDVLERWDLVVSAARQSTLIVNMVDVGDYLDFAVQSLALSLNIPFCLGGTFRSTLTIDYYPASATSPCWGCISDLSDKSIKEKLLPAHVQQLRNLSDFLPVDSLPTGASNVFVASTCGNMMVSAFMQSLHGIEVPTRLIFYYMTYEIDKWKMEVNPDCVLCNGKKK